MSQVPRTLPVVDADTRAFWCGGADGTLRITRCADCGLYLHPPGPICSQCLSKNIEPVAVSGRGTVATFTVNHQPWAPGVPVPFIFAVIELDEQPGLHLMSNVIHCPVENIVVGMRVRVAFEQYGSIWIPLFEPDVK